jgi:hypothetical protein
MWRIPRLLRLFCFFELGGNEVFFRHKSAEKLMGFAQPTLRDLASGADSVRRSRPTVNKVPSLRDSLLQVINFSFLNRVSAFLFNHREHGDTQRKSVSFETPPRSPKPLCPVYFSYHDMQKRDRASLVSSSYHLPVVIGFSIGQVTYFAPFNIRMLQTPSN